MKKNVLITIHLEQVILVILEQIIHIIETMILRMKKHSGIGLMEIQQIPMVAITHTEIITINQLILIIKKKKMFLKRVYLRHYCIRFCKCL